MLHVLKSDFYYSSGLDLEDILAHRLDFSRSEGLETSVDARDVFDTKNTTYLAYNTKAYGLIGAARLLPRESLPLPLQRALPRDREIPFVLADCLFHIPEDSAFFQASDSVIRAHFDFLLEGFYISLVNYLESRVLQDQNPLVYFYLHEEDFDFLARHSERDIVVLKEISSHPDHENIYLGAIDFSDMVHTVTHAARQRQ